MSRWKCCSSSLLPFDNRFCVLRWAARRLEVSVSMSESAPAVTKKFCLKTKNQKSKIKIKMSVPSVTHEFSLQKAKDLKGRERREKREEREEREERGWCVVRRLRCPWTVDPGGSTSGQVNTRWRTHHYDHHKHKPANKRKPLGKRKGEGLRGKPNSV